MLGRPELAEDPRFKTNGDRQNNREALNEVLNAKLAEVDGVSFSLELLKAGLPCGPVLDTKQVLEGAHDGRRLVVFEFPSMDAIHRFWHSPEYEKVKSLRKDAASIDVWAVPAQ